MESISEEAFLATYPQHTVTQPEDVEDAIERLLECATHVSASGGAALAVLRALFGRGSALEITALYSFDRFNREAALRLIRFVAENPGYAATRDPRWSQEIRRDLTGVLTAKAR
jgi:hypothetical protein